MSASNEVVSFTGREIAPVVETAAHAVAAQAKASIEAKYIVAMRNPRDMDTVRDKLLKECKRPSFAAVARYYKPVGKGVEGPSIRFAEAAVRCMGNISPETLTVYDDNAKRILRVSLTDLETNVTYSKDIVLDKTVERSQLKEGQTAISTRMNSYGRLVYLVAATEDDLLNKENAQVSKAIRTLALRVLPGDILDECMTAVKSTTRDSAAKDPDAARKAIMDAFSEVGVKPKDLADYLGHPIDALTPAEVVDLRAIYTSIKAGEADWRDVIALKNPTAQTTDPGATEGAQPSSTGARVAEKLANRRSAKSQTAPAASPAEPAPVAESKEDAEVSEKLVASLVKNLFERMTKLFGKGLVAKKLETATEGAIKSWEDPAAFTPEMVKVIGDWLEAEEGRAGE